MNDRHLSGDFPADTASEFSYAAYDMASYDQSSYGYETGAYATGGYDTAGHDGWSNGSYDGVASPYGQGDPLFGSLHGAQDTGTYPASDYGTYGGDGSDAGYHDTGMWAAADYQAIPFIPHQQGPEQAAQWQGDWDNPGGDGAAYGETGEFAAHGAEAPVYEAIAYDPYETGTYEAVVPGTGAYDPGAFDATAFEATGHDAVGQDTGAYDTGMYDTGTYDAAVYDTGTYDAGAYDPGAYDADAVEAGIHEAGAYETGTYDTGVFDTGNVETGAYDAAGIYETGIHETGHWDGDPQGDPQHPDLAGGEYPAEAYAAYAAYEQPFEPQAAYEGTDPRAGYDGQDAYDGYDTDGAPHDAYGLHEAPHGGHDAQEIPEDQREHVGHRAAEAPEPTEARTPFPRTRESEPEPGAAAAVPAPVLRSRRRSPKPRRSALLTVAAPSVAVLGVAGIAAASVSGSSTEEPVQAAADTSGVEPTAANSKLDTQLAGLSEDADDFADRASRTQERIDLQKRQAEERKRKAAEAARKEAMRPKFALPVSGSGISAGYGQAGLNWMSVHSGVDFPVSSGTPVKAATDGTVSTKWDFSYGNMIILTAPDGTETWYCHLSSTRIRSGSVQAGDVIGYSGSSGNSTGPHLHFEVRPGGGEAIDPLPWFRANGLEPG